MSVSEEHDEEVAFTPVRMWLDDVRRPPSEGWTWVKSVEKAIATFESSIVIEISFDNDLHPFERDGLEVCEWMVEHNVWPGLAHVHTDNRVASTKICNLLERNGYRRVQGRPRSFAKRDGTETRLSSKQFVELSYENSPKSMRRLR